MSCMHACMKVLSLDTMHACNVNCRYHHQIMYKIYMQQRTHQVGISQSFVRVQSCFNSSRVGITQHSCVTKASSMMTGFFQCSQRLINLSLLCDASEQGASSEKLLEYSADILRPSINYTLNVSAQCHAIQGHLGAPGIQRTARLQAFSALLNTPLKKLQKLAGRHSLRRFGPHVWQQLVCLCSSAAPWWSHSLSISLCAFHPGESAYGH